MSGFGEDPADLVSVFFEQERYINQGSLPSSSPSDLTVFSGRYRAVAEGNYVRAHIDLGGRFSTSVERYSELAAYQAYLRWASEYDVRGLPRSRIYIGRTRLNWSHLDSAFSLGLWQPVNRFLPIRSEEMGLTGFFVGLRSSLGDAMFFLSSIFIPEQGPPFELVNGSFRTPSPWFTEPANTVFLYNQPTRINYVLETPAIGSIVNQPSAGVRLRYGDERGRGFSAQAAYIWKPRNSLLTPFRAVLNIGDNPPSARVTVTPQVAFHQLAGVDLYYRFQLATLSMSVLSEWPTDVDVSQERTYRSDQPVHFLSPALSLRLFQESRWPVKLGLALLQTSGGQSVGVGPDGGNLAVFGSRFLWRNAVLVTGEQALIGRSRWRLSHRWRWLEELSEKGSLLNWDVSVDVEPSWRVGLSIDLLASSKPEGDSGTLLARARGFDRVSARLGFHF
jgi:hypothetical protein